MEPQATKMSNDSLRTVLANERTMLAYVRTAFSAVIFGLVILKFFYDTLFLIALSWISIIGGALVLGWGLIEYGIRDRAIREVNR